VKADAIKQNVWPVYVFRPLPDALRGQVFRFAGGLWIPDDGEPDLAFASFAFGPPICLYVSLPYQRNIVLSWTTGHWADNEPLHPRGNAWHYALRSGTRDWGGDWGRDAHENTRAGNSGMNFLCGKARCANGQHVEMNPNDKHIAAGLVWERDTGEVLMIPNDAKCMYCGDSPQASPAAGGGLA
jgi:hypothetical protein